MSVRTKPWAIDGNKHPAQDARIALANELGCDLTTAFTDTNPAQGVTFLDPGHGVTSGAAFKVTENGTPNMSVNVAAGGALIRGTQDTLQGVYSVASEATVNLPIAAAHPTQDRHDLIILRVRDHAFDASGERDAALYVVQGTPSGSPVEPSLATHPSALVLARVVVAAGATSITNIRIADKRVMAGSWARGRGLMGRSPYGGLPGTTVPAGTSVDLGGLDLTFLASAGRAIQCDGLVEVPSSGGGLLNFTLATPVGVVGVGRHDPASGRTSVPLTNIVVPGLPLWAGGPVLTPGVQQFKLRASAGAGAGPSYVGGAGTDTYRFSVTDVGGVLL